MLIRREALDRGDDWSASMMQSLIAHLRLWQGRLHEAVAEAEQARARFRRLGDGFGLVQALSALLRAQSALGRRAAVQRSAEELLALDDVAGAGPIPMLAVAGAAMHRGDGETARRLAQNVLAREQLNLTARHEATVLAALAAAQCGQLDEALEALDRTASMGGRHAFARSVAAVVHALAGDAGAAMREADEVLNGSGASYLDRTFATVAAAAVLARQGRGDDALERVESVLDEVQKVGDVTATALLHRTASVVVGSPERGGVDDLHELGPGWVTILEALAGARSTP